MFERIKRAYAAFIEPQTKYVMRPNVDGVDVPVEVIVGDGKGEYIGEGSQEEYEQQIQDDKGNTAWLKRLKELL